MTTMDFMNDYYFLEEASRFTREIKCNEMVKQTKLSMRFWKLKKEAMNRKTRLYFINCGLSKRKINQSHFKPQEQAIYWTVELVFPNAANVSFRKKICENVKIQDILTKAMESPHFESPKHKQLEFYKAAGVSKLTVLLKAEGLKKSSTRFYAMNQKKSLKANLKGKIIIEFPTLLIILNHTIDDFDVIASDGETCNFYPFAHDLTLYLLDETIEHDLKKFQIEIHDAVFSRKIGENPPLILKPEEVPIISEVVDDNISRDERGATGDCDTSSASPVRYNDKHSRFSGRPHRPPTNKPEVTNANDSDEEVKPENFFTFSS